MELKRIVIWAHVIEKAEHDLQRAHCILSRIATRASDAAYDLEEIENAEREACNKAQDVLYEAGEVLSLLSANLNHLQDHLEKIRQDAEAQKAA